MELFAGIPVSDYDAAVPWYERLLGSPPTFLAHATEAVWELDEHRFVYVEQDPGRAGHALVTLFVDDLDACVAGIAERGLEPADARDLRERGPEGDLPGRRRQRGRLRRGAARRRSGATDARADRRQGRLDPASGATRRSGVTGRLTGTASDSSAGIRIHSTG